MYLPTTLLFLPLLGLVDAQLALPDQAAALLEKAKNVFFPGLLGSGAANVVPEVLDAGASVVAGGIVEKINIRNWQRKLAPKPDVVEEWMIYLTGGNKTCYGKCGPMNTMWNESIPLLAALKAPAGSPRLKLGVLNCEVDEVLCTAWASGVPVIYHFMVPAQSPTAQPVPLHVIPLNMSTTEVSDIVAIPAAGGKSKYLDYEEYTGLLHPIDGLLAQFGLLQPFGYFMWGLGSMPGWVMMLGISFVSRQIMSRRMANTGGSGIPQAVPEPRVAPASGSQPRAAPGSAKKRK